MIEGTMLQDSEFELEPWLVFAGPESGQTVCTWNVEKLNAEALALFTSREKADNYATEFGVQLHDLRQVANADLVRLFIRCYEAGVRHAVLDPSKNSASKLFELRSVLAAARDRLRQQGAE